LFSGEFKHAVDGKGRVSVPSRVRDVLKTKHDDELLVVTRSPADSCLWAFPQSLFEKLATEIASRGVGNRALMKLRRKVFHAATPCSIDKHGRILLPEKLREYADIVKEAVFVGQLTYVELWAPGRWETELDTLDEDATVDSMLNTMSELGL